MEITEFLTYDNIGLMTQIIISGLVVMATTQAFKSVVDRLIKFISRGKIKKIKTRVKITKMIIPINHLNLKAS